MLKKNRIAKRTNTAVLIDTIDGLRGDLDFALDVMWRHGDREAHDWMWLNYPKQAREFALGSSRVATQTGGLHDKGN